MSWDNCRNRYDFSFSILLVIHAEYTWLLVSLTAESLQRMSAKFQSISQRIGDKVAHKHYYYYNRFTALSISIRLIIIKVIV